MGNILNSKKTKIVCTIGPASNSPGVIEELILSGMNVARLNFSHGDKEAHKETAELIRAAAKKLDVEVSILQDLPGPKIRIGKLDKEEYILNTHDLVVLTKEKIIGNNKRFSCSHDEVFEFLEVNDIIFLNDGRIRLIVKDKKQDELLLEVLNKGEIRSFKGLNVPSENCTINAITEQDIEYIKFGIDIDVDIIAASFIKKKDDILKVRDLVKRSGKNIYVIGKIESPSALKNIDGILEASDGIMVARGDLGIENPIEDVALNQKMLINKARSMSKASIVATQMLRSMIDNPVPTRAEVSDITNAILDGADALMLSEETAIGQYPVQACETMKNVCFTIEKELKNLKHFEEITLKPDIFTEQSISHAVKLIAGELDISAFIVLTKTGKTAHLISSCKNNQPVLAFTDDKKVVKHLNLRWGVIPIYIKECPGEGLAACNVLEYIRNNNILPEDSLVLLTGRSENKKNISTNKIELHHV